MSETKTHKKESEMTRTYHEQLNSVKCETTKNQIRKIEEDRKVKRGQINQNFSISEHGAAAGKIDREANKRIETILERNLA